MARVSGYTKENKHPSARESTRSSAQEVGQSADSMRAISSHFRSAIDVVGTLATKTCRSYDNSRRPAKLTKVSSRVREIRIDKSRLSSTTTFNRRDAVASPRVPPISIQAEVNL